MADKKISELTAYTTPIGTDVLPIVDVSTTTTKKIALSTLVTATTARARAYRNGTQDDIVSATFTKIQLNAEDYDSGSNFDAATNFRFVAPVSGYYLITGCVRWINIVVDKTYIGCIYKNDALVASSGVHYPGGLAGISSTVTTVLYLAATDYVELWGYHDAGVNTVDIETGSDQTYLAVHLLSLA